jgi:hypothetical protein
MAGKLSDNDISDRLYAAIEALGLEEDAETVRGDTTLKAARQALNLLHLGLLAAGNAHEDENPVIRPRGPLAPP